MFAALPYEVFQTQTKLRHGHHLDRTLQFAERHRWPLNIGADSLEIDDFDCNGTTYCLAHEAGQHQASLRVRRTEHGTMLERAFRPVWERHAADFRGALEVTRMCSGRYLPEAVRKRATVEMLLGLCRFGMRSGQKDLFGIVYPGVMRAICRAGWRCSVVESFENDGRTILLARWECSGLVDWRLQERLEALSDAQPIATAEVAAA